MEMKLNEWRPGTAQVVNHKILAEYIQDTASKSGVDSCTLYNTRVEHAFKQASKWYLETSTLNTNEMGKCKNTNDIWARQALNLSIEVGLIEIRNSTLLSLLQVIIMPAEYPIYLD